MKRVLITRALEDAYECVNIFSALELTPFVLPMIQTAPLPPPKFEFTSYDYCILTSPAAVRYFEPYQTHLFIEKFAAIGGVTAERLRNRYGAVEPLIPREAASDSIAALFEDMPLEGAKILSPGAKRRFGSLESFFKEKGAHFEAVCIYETETVEYEKDKVNIFLSANRIEGVAFFSPSAASAFMQQAVLGAAAAVCIGNSTAEMLKSYGITPFIAPEPSAKALACYIRDIP
ncbi:MAG: uroporphyrinogen-III synthase [Deferribacteraceae bacterium]|jgi:uroporphyrinogen-III synthase|nr:uroporphyrinogen-III synthase [Deferribacteraceae bacterium]